MGQLGRTQESQAASEKKLKAYACELEQKLEARTRELAESRRHLSEAREQQAERMRLVCILQGVSADTPGQKARDAAFLEGLQHLGWTPRPCGVWLRRELVPAGLQRNRLYDV